MFYFLAIVLLSLFDMMATHYSVEVVGTYDIEVNPLMRWVMKTWGMTGTYLLRLLLPTILVPVLLHLRDNHQSTTALAALRIALVAHTLVIGWHFYETNYFTLHLG